MEKKKEFIYSFLSFGSFLSPAVLKKTMGVSEEEEKSERWNDKEKGRVRNLAPGQDFGSRCPFEGCRESQPTSLGVECNCNLTPL